MNYLSLNHLVFGRTNSFAIALLAIYKFYNSHYLYYSTKFVWIAYCIHAEILQIFHSLFKTLNYFFTAKNYLQQRRHNSI